MRCLSSAAVIGLLCACDPVAGADAGLDAPVARPDAGPSNVAVFAELGASSEGIALGRDASDAPVLYVGLRDGRIVEVTPDGVVSDFVAIDDPLGIAVRASGELVVCARQAATDGGAPGIFEVSLAGAVTPLVTETPEGAPFGLTNFVAIAPDGSLVFSDSMANVVYGADADGSNVAAITTSITYPNGLAFSADGSRLFIASWNTSTLHAASFAAGAYGAPAPVLEGVMNVDGIVPAAGDGLVLITSVRGGLHVTPPFSAEPAVLFTTREASLPANAVFGDAAFGTSNLYVSSLASSSLYVVSTELTAP